MNSAGPARRAGRCHGRPKTSPAGLRRHSTQSRCACGGRLSRPHHPGSRPASARLSSAFTRHAGNAGRRRSYLFSFFRRTGLCRRTHRLPTQPRSGRQRYRPPWKSLILMRICRHHVIAHSTFSWWGAWLAEAGGRVVIVPRDWHTPLSLPAMDISQCLSQEWISSQGMVLAVRPPSNSVATGRATC